MRYAWSLLDNEGDPLGPGTDLIIALVSVMILLVGVLQKDFSASKAELLRNEVRRKRQQNISDSIRNELKHQLSHYRNKYEREQALLERIKNQQNVIIKEIGEQSRSVPLNVVGDKNRYKIPINYRENVYIFNDISSQWISFGTGILFEKESSILSYEGRQMLRLVGNAFLRQIDNIQEIQILGHADITGDAGFNLRLAGERAMSVFQFLQEQIAINPAEKIMSATSYGEYMPVQRTYNDTTYNEQKLEDHNYLPDERDRNRRIEIVLKFNTEKH